MPVPEEQRHTERITLRLPRDVMRALRDEARERGVSVAAVVADLVVQRRPT